MADNDTLKQNALRLKIDRLLVRLDSANEQDRALIIGQVVTVAGEHLLLPYLAEKLRTSSITNQEALVAAVTAQFPDQSHLFAVSETPPTRETESLGVMPARASADLVSPAIAAQSPEPSELPPVRPTLDLVSPPPAAVPAAIGIEQSELGTQSPAKAEQSAPPIIAPVLEVDGESTARDVQPLRTVVAAEDVPLPGEGTEPIVIVRTPPASSGGSLGGRRPLADSGRPTTVAGEGEAFANLGDPYPDPARRFDPLLAFVHNRGVPFAHRRYVARLLLHIGSQHVQDIPALSPPQRTTLAKISGKRTLIEKLPVVAFVAAVASIAVFFIYNQSLRPLFESPAPVVVAVLSQSSPSVAPAPETAPPSVAAPPAVAPQPVDPLADIRALETTDPFTATHRFIAAGVRSEAQRVVSKLIAETCTSIGNAADKAVVKDLAETVQVDATACAPSAVLKPKPQPRTGPIEKQACTDANIIRALSAKPDGNYMVDGNVAYKVGTVGQEIRLNLKPCPKRAVRVQ